MTTPTDGGQFASTRWTQILAAAAPAHPDAREALASLCRTYWPPLYAFVRRRGFGPADAEDLTQGFFARLLRLDSLAGVRRERGRFRSFLLAALRNYLADERDRAHAAKRGAGLVVPIDAAEAESGYQREPADAAATPDAAFDRAWALTLLQTVTTRLQQDHVAAGQGELFAALSFCLTGSRGGPPYAELAAKLGLSEPAVRVAVHRLRKRYRQLLREEIAQTVARPEDVDNELRELRQALTG
jgi:RNA polymerase sigma-70 factor (ECF subfamily)